MNTILSERPTVDFDAANKIHRAHYAQFQQDGGWGKCPVRFMLDKTNSNVISMINTRLLDYYLSKEFKK